MNTISDRPVTSDEVIKNLAISPDQLELIKTPLKLLTKDEISFAFNLSERIFNEEMRLKDEAKALEKKVPFWEDNQHVTHQTKKFY